MKILFLISEHFYVLSHRVELLRGLLARGYTVEVATNMNSSENFYESIGIKSYQIDIHRESLSPYSIFKAAFDYRRIIQRSNPDLVIAVALKPIVATCALRFVGVKLPVLCAFAGLGGAFASNVQSLKLRFIRYCMKVSFRPLLSSRHTYCLFQNSEDRDLFEKRNWSPPDRNFLIRGAGIKLADYQVQKKCVGEPMVFLFVGRLLWEKGVKVIAKACTELRSNGVHFRFLVAGMIDETNTSSVPVKYLENLHSTGIIEWLGYQKDVPKLLSTVDCFVFPSYYREGVPRVLLESSAAGVPMITTDTPGCSDVVEPHVTGLLVSPNSVSELIEALKFCTNNPQSLIAWGNNARSRAEKYYSIESVIEDHITILSKISTDRSNAGFV